MEFGILDEVDANIVGKKAEEELLGAVEVA